MWRFPPGRKPIKFIEVGSTRQEEHGCLSLTRHTFSTLYILKKVEYQQGKCLSSTTVFAEAARQAHILRSGECPKAV